MALNGIDNYYRFNNRRRLMYFILDQIIIPTEPKPIKFLYNVLIGEKTSTT